MTQVAVTGLGALITNSMGVLGGWSSASCDSDIFRRVPPLTGGMFGMIERESQGLFGTLTPNAILAERRSVVWGISKNHFSSWENWVQGEQGDEFFSDFDGHFLAERYGLGGQVLCPVAACATGAHAIALGARLIEGGEADVVLCGASEPPQHPMILAAYRNMGAVSAQGVMRPFDRRRDGFVPASGSGFLILESLEHAHGRGANVHAVVAGYAMRADATHITSMCPSGDSVVRAVEEALGNAGNPRIGYINAHGTATRQNDELEAKALGRVFGTGVPVSSTKALTGHLLGASGVVEAVLSILALKMGQLPLTLGLDEPEYELDFVRERKRVACIDSVLSLNYGFGGHMGALIFKHEKRKNVLTL